MRRTWLVVLLLAALFSMHGLPSLPREDGVAAGGSAAHLAGDMAVDEFVLAPAAVHSIVDGTMHGRVAPDQGMPAGHGMSAHLWSLCLAILLAGAVLVVRSLFGWTSPVERMSSGSRRVQPPTGLAGVVRPPDLSALCLLRI